MEAAKSSETLVSCHSTSQCKSLEDLDLSLHRRENLKSHLQFTLSVAFEA